MFIAVILIVFTSMLLKGINQNIISFLSLISKCFLSIVKYFIIWVITIGFGWDEWEIFRLIGYIIVGLGFLINNEIIILPSFGFKVNFKKNISLLVSM